MSSSASRTLLAAIAAIFPLSCSSVPEDLFTKGGAAGAAGAGAAKGGASSTGGGGGAGGGGGVAIGSGGAPSTAGGSLATGGVGGQVTTLNFEQTISKPSDDCTWINNQERLRFSDTEQVLEVGTDAEMGRVGLRFTLPIAAGSRIVTAILRVYRVGGEAAEADTLTVQVFDVANVAAFDATHTHGAAEHATGGLWAIKATGMPVGKANQFTQSPDLTPLIQHVLDKPDWMPGGGIGFVLSPETMTGWASYGDSSAGTGKSASLRVTYVPR